MEFYIASEQGPLGPYTIEQLKERRLKAEEMVWRNGMEEWTRADQVPELDEVLNSPVLPPTFNRQRFESQTATVHNNYTQETHPQYHYDNSEECPPTYRWLAIIAFFGIIPCAIVALIKSVMVTRLWEEGNREAARYQSRKALMWGTIGAAIGIPLSIYMLFFSDQTEMTQNLIEQLM